MFFGRVEIKAVFRNVILLVNVIALRLSAAPADLAYKCDDTGVVLAGQKSTLGHISVASGNSDSLIYCKPTDMGMTNCKSRQGQDKNSLTVIYKDVTTSDIISGIHTFKFYKLVCTDEATKTKQKAVFKAIGEQTGIHEQTEKITHEFILQLKKDTKDATQLPNLKIGDSLKLQMTGTDVVITPEICSAYPRGESASKVTIWEASGIDQHKVCTNSESSVINTSKWSHIAGDTSGIEITLFAFRFATKAEVELECTATVCSKTKTTGCTQDCVIDTNGTPAPQIIRVTTPKNVTKPDVHRKRRSIDIIRKDGSRRTRSSSVSFTVRENEAQDNSSPGLSVGYVTLVTIGVVLLFMS